MLIAGWWLVADVELVREKNPVGWVAE